MKALRRVPSRRPQRAAVAVPPERAAPVARTADRWLSRFRSLLVAVLGGTVAGIASLAFFTSFEAIKAYANTSHGIDPHHDFAIPLLVDSFIVVATGADLWFATTGQQRRLWEVWWPKALLAGAAGVSFVLNVAHVEHGNWAARGVAAIPPAALILGVELLMMVLRRATAIRTERLQAAAVPGAGPVEVPPVAVEVSRTDAAASAGTTAAPASPVPALEAGPSRDTPPTPARARSRSRSAKSPRTPASTSTTARMRAHVRDELAAGREPEGTAVARRFGVDASLGRRTVREVKAELAGQALAAGNGHPPTTPAVPPAVPDEQEPPRTPHLREEGAAAVRERGEEPSGA